MTAEEARQLSELLRKHAEDIRSNHGEYSKSYAAEVDDMADMVRQMYLV